MELRPFNKLIANCDAKTRAEVKRLRRRLRNRGYANTARVRRDGEATSHESEISRLRRRGDELRREINKTAKHISATRAKLQVLEDIAPSSKMPPHAAPSSSAARQAAITKLKRLPHWKFIVYAV